MTVTTLSALYPYKPGSRSASALATALGIPQIRHSGSRFKGSRHKTVINWGASELPHEVMRCDVLNVSQAVKVAGNKLLFFKSSEGISHNAPRLVPWTATKEVAQNWLNSGLTVVVRGSLTGHSGQGITICKPKDTLPDAPLYTKYVSKVSEWRVHAAFGEVIDIQRKIRDPAREPIDWYVRSHGNGFVYVRNTTPCPDDVPAQALLAFKASKLDFCGIDVVVGRRDELAYVLEVNTAIGLEGQTIQSYKNAFLKKLGGNHVT